MVGRRDGGKGHRPGRRKKKMCSYLLRLIEIAYIVKKIVIAYIVKEKFAIAYAMIDAPAVAFRVPDYCVRVRWAFPSCPPASALWSLWPA